MCNRLRNLDTLAITDLADNNNGGPTLDSLGGSTVDTIRVIYRLDSRRENPARNYN